MGKIKPLVNVCIPNYNNAKYLDTCIQSALNQTYQNIEVILMDNCSTDNSIEIAEKYSDKIRIIQNPINIGQPKNTNKCIEYSNGKYCVILHSDDFLLPNFAEKLVPVLEEYSNINMAIGERMETDEFGVPAKIAPFYNVDCVIPGEKQAKVFMMSSVLTCQVLFRTETFKNIGGIDERHVINLDGLLWFKFSLSGDVGYIKTPVSVYRRHDESTTAQYNHSIDLIIEHYCAITEMFRIAKGRPYLEQFFNDAIKRLGNITLRYCHNLFRIKNYELVKKYLLLATVFDSDIVNNITYRTLKYCIEANDTDKFKLYQKLLDIIDEEIRTFSYDPPKGFVPLC